MEVSKWITKVFVPVVTALIGAVGGNFYGEKQGKEKIISKINQETNVNVNLGNYLDVVNKLSEENVNLKTENEQLREDNDNTAQETETSAEESSSEGSSLLEVSKAMNACGGYEEVRDSTMSLRGTNYSDGFILRYSNRDEGVEFKLNKKYDTLSFDLGHLDESDKEGKFTLIIFADGKQEKVITQNPEDPVTHYDVSINKADIIKIEWSPERYADFGMANVKVK